jgi:hypothetical protein
MVPPPMGVQLPDSNSATPLADTKNVSFAIAVVVFAMLSLWPFADMPYGDDFAYSHVALRLSQTGHMMYNGWEFAMLLAHAYWGVLFIRLFGFSFQCLRLSTIPFALGTVALCYLLVRRAGLNPSSALLTTLIVALSPVFLLLSATYMTDIPCLFFTIASLYSLSRAAELSTNYRGYLWLFLGAATAFIGGTGRQVVWLVPLLLLPYMAFLKRRHLRFATASVLVWIVTAGGVALASAWLDHQLYVGAQLSVFHQLKLVLKHPFAELNIFSRVALMLLFFVLPAAIPLTARSFLKTWRGSLIRKAFVGVPLLVVFAAILIHPSLASIPWVGSTFNWEGINGVLPGFPVVLTPPIRAVAALAVYLTACILAGELLEIRRLARRGFQFLLNPPAHQFALAGMSAFSAVYFVLLVLRGVEVDIFDRYLLPLMPCIATLLLVWSESDVPDADTSPRRAMPIAWATVAVIACYGIASTQDFWALARARVIATRKLEAAGVPRTSISAGLEYNGWTQLLVNGQINDPWVKNPPNAFRPGFGATPAVVPGFVLEYKPTGDTEPTEFGAVPYSSMLPPFQRQVSIDRVLAGHPPPGLAIWKERYP